MKKITRRNFLIASGKTVGTLAAASAFMGCASPEQAENCFPRSAMPVRTDDRLTAIDNIVENYMGQGYFPGATIVVARGGKIVYEKAYGYAIFVVCQGGLLQVVLLGNVLVKQFVQRNALCTVGVKTIFDCSANFDLFFS